MEKYNMEELTADEGYNVKMYGEFERYLQCIYDVRDSFYKKAFLVKYENTLYLISYNTVVAKYKDGKIFIDGWYSQTTGRHINEFAQQMGFEKFTKKEMEESKSWVI